MKKLIPIALVLFAISTQGALDAAPAQAGASEQADTKVVVFKITGMVTDNCPVLVKEAVGRIDGVKRVDASLKTKSVRVEYIEGRTSPEAIRKVIKDQTGFDAEIERKE
ncbi:MAG: heavy-metal-associated domain-containing protein [Myxococcota bacterium]